MTSMSGTLRRRICRICADAWRTRSIPGSFSTEGAAKSTSAVSSPQRRDCLARCAELSLCRFLRVSVHRFNRKHRLYSMTRSSEGPVVLTTGWTSCCGLDEVWSLADAGKSQQEGQQEFREPSLRPDKKGQTSCTICLRSPWFEPLQSLF